MSPKHNTLILHDELLSLSESLPPCPISLDPIPDLPPRTPTPHRRAPTKKTKAYHAAIRLLDEFEQTLHLQICAASAENPGCGALMALWIEAEQALGAKSDEFFVYREGEDVAYDADVEAVSGVVEGVKSVWEGLVREGVVCVDEGVCLE